MRGIFLNTNDKTFPSTLNNLLYSHQQFLPEQTATSHASSSLHVLHQASSFIKKLTIMTQPRMIEQRREFVTSRYLKISYHSNFPQLFQASSRRITVFREMRGATLRLGPSPGLAFSASDAASRSSNPPPSAPTDAADMFQNMSSTMQKCITG